jgi:hypothetical protein
VPCVNSELSQGTGGLRKLAPYRDRPREYLRAASETSQACFL